MFQLMLHIIKQKQLLCLLVTKQYVLKCICIQCCAYQISIIWERYFNSVALALSETSMKFEQIIGWFNSSRECVGFIPAECVGSIPAECVCFIPAESVLVPFQQSVLVPFQQSVLVPFQQSVLVPFQQRVCWFHSSRVCGSIPAESVLVKFQRIQGLFNSSR